MFIHSQQNGDKYSASGSGRCVPGERVSGTYSIDGCLNIRRAVDMLAKTEMATSAGNQIPIETLSARFTDRVRLA